MQAFLICSLLWGASTPLPVGKSLIEQQFGDVTIKLFNYKPADYSDGPIIMVCHGVLRNAEEYRDDAIEMAERFGALIVAPLFDAEQFPFRRYQLGGIVEDGKVVRSEDWTGNYVNRILKNIREKEGRPQAPLYLIGHSGGGQFLARITGFVQTDAVRIVSSNAGTHLFPTRDASYPYGFGGLPPELQSDEILKAYLERPLTLYLGSQDIERDEYLDVSERADQQGAFRFERGQHVYEAARALAVERGWKFGWKLVIAEGIEHDHTNMFNHPACATAFELPIRKPAQVK